MINNTVREFGYQTASCAWTELLVGNGNLPYTRNGTENFTTESVSETDLF